MIEARGELGSRELRVLQLRFLLATGRRGFPSRSDSVARLHLVKLVYRPAGEVRCSKD
jgi:hypothetical protein